MGPLSGLRIIELPAVGPVPFAGMMLAEMGADVLRLTRIEQTDLGIHVDPKFHTVFRSRPSLGVDLKKPEGVEVVLKLIESSDGLIEGFRPGVMERLGISPEICLKRNPRLAYGRMTGWGQEGPLSSVAGHDINYIAVSGVLSAIGERGGKPVFPLNLVGDFGGGALYLCVGLLAAILSAKETGRGQVIDAAMVDGAASLMTHLYGFLGAGLWQEGRGQNILDSGAHFYNVYETADGKFIGIGPIEAKFYRELLKQLGLSEDKELVEKFMDRSSWPASKEKFAAAFKTKTRQEWTSLLERLDVCVSPIMGMKEAVNHPHIASRGIFVEVDEVLQPAPAPRFSETKSEIRSSPAAKFDCETTLQDWGFDSENIRKLKSIRAIA